MSKKRNKQKLGLPARWRRKHNAHYYRVPPGDEEHWDGKKEFRLGRSLDGAYRTLSRWLDEHIEARDFGELPDRYDLKVVPLKAPKNQQSNRILMKRLRKAVHIYVDLPTCLYLYTFNSPIPILYIYLF